VTRQSDVTCQRRALPVYEPNTEPRYGGVEPREVNIGTGRGDSVCVAPRSVLSPSHRINVPTSLTVQLTRRLARHSQNGERGSSGPCPRIVEHVEGLAMSRGLEIDDEREDRRGLPVPHRAVSPRTSPCGPARLTPELGLQRSPIGPSPCHADPSARRSRIATALFVCAARRATFSPRPASSGRRRLGRVFRPPLCGV
jgi:hypothetical protein